MPILIRVLPPVDRTTVFLQMLVYFHHFSYLLLISHYSYLSHHYGLMSLISLFLRYQANLLKYKLYYIAPLCKSFTHGYSMNFTLFIIFKVLFWGQNCFYGMHQYCTNMLQSFSPLLLTHINLLPTYLIYLFIKFVGITSIRKII